VTVLCGQVEKWSFPAPERGGKVHVKVVLAVKS